MTTKELYRKHKSGDISNQKFLYEVRRDAKLPWINNLTSYEDAVKILKNKGIINEAEDGKQDVVVIAKTVDMVNPYEYANGLDYELGQSMVPVRCDLTEDEVLAAQKKVLNNLTKDPNYYTKVMNGLKPKDPILGPREIEVTEKSIKDVEKGPVKADGYIKKELKKDAKANVKDNLGDSEKAPKKPKGVEEFKDKGVTGSFKTIKEGIEEIIREKLAKKKADEAKVEEGEAKVKVGDIVIPNKGPHKGQKHEVIHVFDDGTFNIKPIGTWLRSKDIKYKLGAAKAKPEDVDLQENVKEGLEVKKHDNEIEIDADSGDYTGFIEDDGTVTFAVEYNDVDTITDDNWKEELGPNHAFVQIYNAIGGDVSTEKNYVQITVNADRLLDRYENIEEGSKDPYDKAKVINVKGKFEVYTTQDGKIKTFDTEAEAKEFADEYNKKNIKEHHNDPNFPIVKGLYDLLDAIVADWGKEDLYHDVEDVVVAYINPDDAAVSKEAIKKIKDVLENYDVLEDYAELVNGIAVKEPGTGFRPGVNLGSSFEKFKASLKEKLKADVKKEALVVPKNTAPDQIKKYSSQGIDVKLDVK